jgi:hypothetical protein
MGTRAFNNILRGMVMASPGGSRTLKLSILADIDNLNKSLKQGEAGVSGFTSKIQGFSDKMSLAFKVATAAAAAFAIKIGIDSIKAASDLGETISKVGVLFGDSAKDIEEFAGKAAQSLGQTKQQALDAAANFAIFGKSAGLSGEELVKFSTEFVSLAGDLSSFNNVSQDDAINAIGSALRGEAEPLRRFGVLLDEATLKNAALQLGLITTTKEALTPQQKVLAAQKVIYEQTTTAQGDFARTSDGLANQTKILSAELENTKLIIGEALLPLVLELATAFQEKMVPLIKQFAYGLTGKNGVNDGLTESEKSAYLWGQRIRKIIDIVVGLKDELVVLSATIVGIFVVSKIAAGVQATIVAIGLLIKAYNALKASAIVAGIASAFALNPLLGAGAAVVAAGVLAAGFKIANQYDTKAVTSEPSMGSTLDWNAISQSNSSSGASSPGGFSVPTVTVPKISGATAATASVAASSKNSGFVNQPNSKSNFAADKAAAEAAIASTQQNVTVNIGVVGDPEAAARTITQVLNNSYYRGTNGAGALVF